VPRCIAETLRALPFCIAPLPSVPPPLRFLPTCGRRSTFLLLLSAGGTAAGFILPAACLAGRLFCSRWRVGRTTFLREATTGILPLLPPYCTSQAIELMDAMYFRSPLHGDAAGHTFFALPILSPFLLLRA